MLEFGLWLHQELDNIQWERRPRKIEWILQKNLNHDDLKAYSNGVYFYFENERTIERQEVQSWCILTCAHNANSQVDAQNVCLELDKYLTKIKNKFCKKNLWTTYGHLNYEGAVLSTYESSFCTAKMNFNLTKNIC